MKLENFLIALVVPHKIEKPRKGALFICGKKIMAERYSSSNPGALYLEKEVLLGRLSIMKSIENAAAPKLFD